MTPAPRQRSGVRSSTTEVLDGATGQFIDTATVLRSSKCSICESPFMLNVGQRMSSTCAGKKCQTIRAAQNRRWKRKREMYVRRYGQRPYNDPDYRAMKQWLKANPQTQCWFPDCDARATTLDHVPALMHHRHVRGSGCCHLRPACLSCNCSHGATEGNKAREPHTSW